MALVLIGAAIVGLSLVDRMTVVDRPQPRPLPSVAVAPPLTPPATDSAPTEPAVETPPDPSASVPPPPEVSRVPDPHQAAPAAPVVVPSLPKTTDPEAAKPSAPAAPQTPGRSPSPSAAPPAASSSASAPASPPPPAPSAAAAKPATPMLRLDEGPIAPAKGYTVQMGVFNTYGNADSLLAKLKERGIPAYAETRVVVGPFRTRREADQAARAIKDLGAGRVLRPGAR